MPFSISYRESFRWLPSSASETTQTIVLSAPRTKSFLDVRFSVTSKSLEWAFAGRKSTTDTTTKFMHEIDSTNYSNPSSVLDSGILITLPDGRQIEAGEMINPQTGLMESYEEIWRDEECSTGLFVKTKNGKRWQARAGNRVQLALGWSSENVFWAWQAKKSEGEWKVEYSTPGAHVIFLPEPGEEFLDGKEVQWDGETWIVLEVER